MTVITTTRDVLAEDCCEICEGSSLNGQYTVNQFRTIDGEWWSNPANSEERSTTLRRRVSSGSTGEGIEMSVVNTEEANVDDDDDIDESLEADADAAIGFSAQRLALRRALRAIWAEHDAPELTPERRTA